MKAERKQKADAKKEKEKADKAAYAASPQGQAETWLKNVVKDIHALNTAKARLESTDVLQGEKNEWVKQLDKHHAVLVEIRIRMEAVRALTEQPTANLFVDGRQKVQPCSYVGHFPEKARSGARSTHVQQCLPWVRAEGL